MQSKLVILCLIVVACNASLWTSEEPRSDTGLVDGFSKSDARLLGGATQTAIPATAQYLAGIVDTTGLLGTGIIVNKYLVLTLTNVVLGKTASSLFLIAGLDPILIMGTGGVIRKGKQIIHKQATPAACSATALLDCVSLVRVCPSFAVTFAVLDTTMTYARTLTNTVNLYSFQSPIAPITAGQKPLALLNKNIGEYCECKDIAGFLVASHACLAEDPAKSGENLDETKGVVVTSSDNLKVIGFLVKQQIAAGGQGEVVLHLSAYASFISGVDLTVYEYQV